MEALSSIIFSRYHLIAVKRPLLESLPDLSSGTVDWNPPANAGDMGSIPGSGSFHMPWSNCACIPQLLGLSAGTTKACAPRAQAPKQEKPLHQGVLASQQRVGPARHS